MKNRSQYFREHLTREKEEDFLRLEDTPGEV